MFWTIKGKFSWNTVCTSSYWKHVHVPCHHKYHIGKHANLYLGSNTSDDTENKMGRAYNTNGKNDIFTEKFYTENMKKTT